MELRGQSQKENTPIRRVISNILEWQEGERPKTDWNAIKETESGVQHYEQSKVANRATTEDETSMHHTETANSWNVNS